MELIKTIGLALGRLVRGLALGFCLSLSSPAISQQRYPIASEVVARAQLVDLENFVSEYSDVRAFLSNPGGLDEYRRLIKSYMGYNNDFDPIFDLTMQQMRVLVGNVPGFAEGIWQNQAAGEDSIRVEASTLKRSGIETKLNLLSAQLTAQRERYADQAEEIVNLASSQQQAAEVIALVQQVQNSLQLIEGSYSDTIKIPSNTALKSFSPDQHEQRSEYINKLRSLFKDNAQVKSLHAFIKYKVSGHETWLDRYRSSFAEDSLRALEDLQSLRSLYPGMVSTPC